MVKSNILKSNKGVTLLSLITYIIVFLIVVGVMGTISTFFYNNLTIVRNSAQYCAEFDKFNVFFVNDVKNNNHVNIDTQNNIITFIDGTTYKYNPEDKGIYRGEVKIATNVEAFNASKRTITINNVDKEIVSINILIGDSTKTLIQKNIDYTLKYW